jgi:hypothetical protein
MCAERRDMAIGNGTSSLRAGNALDRSFDAERPYPAPVPRGVPAFLVPKSLGEVRELARMIALAEWAPDCYRDLDGNYLQPKVELAILHGATVGLGPIAAVHAIALIGGVPSIWGDGALSVIEHSGLLEDMAENYEVDDEEGLTAICTMKRRDRATPIVTRFSIAMAERAGLTRNEGPWQSYPERMLRMRARSWTMRDAFADVLRGLQLREEVEDHVGSKGERTPLIPHRDGRPPGNLRHYASPRPRRPVGSHGAGLPDDRSTTVSGPSNGHSDDRIAAGPPPVEETFALIDTDGGVIDVVGPEVLRAAFERLIGDKHLSPAQVAGVWESNEPARQAIERLFGPEALLEAKEHLKSVEAVRNAPDNDQPALARPSCDAAASSAGTGPAPPSEPDRALALEISPTWGIQKIFQQYRSALTALSDGPAQNKPTIARFREANIAVEERLRAKLPDRIGPIDAIYQRAGIEP